MSKEIQKRDRNSAKQPIETPTNFTNGVNPNKNVKPTTPPPGGDKKTK